ncbi:hypothetical protein K443DRAFT_111653 [Laccaria amethystina LaAM-08-1]|uniref:CxC5 like cysteine cluster associated with KDZ domain-containing protein n=1 Tax=Laccaria amethystina LaAM-08-1 TaxID=1095629 RepID=A0A0C9X7U3_9AGAR|nr:hypothetical protein K443DRAFT_111653 [Laccaria amethystina LaAM-08-1]
MLCGKFYILLQVFSPLIVVIFLCPGVNAAPSEQSFPEISFKVFNTFIEQNFSSKISLATVLMLLFTLNENTDLLNLHQRQQNPQLKGIERRVDLSAWIKSLAREIQLQTTETKFKTLFKKYDVLKSLPDAEVVNVLGTKLNGLADVLGLKAYGNNGKLIKKLQPISKNAIQPILVICPPLFNCSDKKCNGRSILQLTDKDDVPHVTLLKGSEIFENVTVLSGYCANCQTHYFSDHETYKDLPSNSRKRVYLHNAKYLKIGQSLYVDRIFSNAVMNGIYSFHASTAAYAEFWTNSYGKVNAFKIQRRQIWHTFIQESIRILSQASNILFEVSDNSSIQDLTHDAFAILGEQGGIRLANKHGCSECTQEYKSVADWVPPANDAAAVLETQKGVVKMVVMDGIVMGPTHCAFDNCTGALANAHGHGESFCKVHRTQFQNCCRVRDCTNNRVQGTQACQQHRNEWHKYTQSRTASSLAGVRRMLNHPNENYEWHGERLTNDQPHDEEAPEPAKKNYFSPSRFYCVETICAPCGVVIAWTKFAKSESPTNILRFLTATYPTEATRPDYVCIDKACQVLRTSIQNGTWDEWSKTTRIIVDSYHYVNHRVKDWLCRVFCNPAPLDGSAPNLVIEAETKYGEKYLKRAFNTQACEQLNGWIGGFESILKRMTIDNFNWFLHVMLFYHTRNVLDKIKEREEKKNENHELSDDGDDDDM